MNRGSYEQFPDQISVINKTMANQSSDKRCLLLMSYGHNLAQEILDNFGNFEEPTSPDEEPLDNIRENKGLMYMLQKATEIFPRIAKARKRSFTLSYRRRNKK